MSYLYETLLSGTSAEEICQAISNEIVVEGAPLDCIMKEISSSRVAASRFTELSIYWLDTYALLCEKNEAIDSTKIVKNIRRFTREVLKNRVLRILYDSNNKPTDFTNVARNAVMLIAGMPNMDQNLWSNFCCSTIHHIGNLEKAA